MKHLKRLCLICGALFLFAIPFSACTEESEDTDLDSSLNADTDIDLNNDSEIDSKSYEGTDDEGMFFFSFQIDQTEFSSAESINGTLTAYVTNVSGETYTMSRTQYFEPGVVVYHHENSQCLLQLETVSTDEYLQGYAGETLDISNGQRGSKTFWFNKYQTKVTVGSYDVKVYFRSYIDGVVYSVIFENVITVTE